MRFADFDDDDAAAVVVVAWGRERIAAGFWESLMREVEAVVVRRNEELVVELCDLKMDGAGAVCGRRVVKAARAKMVQKQNGPVSVAVAFQMQWLGIQAEMLDLPLG